MPLLRVLTQGGSMAPNDLRQVAGWAFDYGHDRPVLTVLEISNRQEILLNPPTAIIREDLARRIHGLGLVTDEAAPQAQNIVTSLPATDVLTDTPWLTAGVYLDVLAQFTTAPQLKVNVIDPAQSLVSGVTGNINFVAAPEPNYWYILLRPSGSVRRYVWPVLIESESIGQFAEVVERHYRANEADRGERATFETFYRAVMADFRGNTRKPTRDMPTMATGVPVYEGFHQTRSGNYWLGLFRKQYVFSTEFILALCDLCRETRLGKIYLTPYKTLLIKDIREAERPAWEQLLGRFGMRTNLPAWHLNWQMPNASEQAVALKNQVLRQLDDTDVRTDQLSFAVDIPFSEAAASVVLHQNGSPESFDVYQRTGQSVATTQYVLFAKSQPIAQLGEAIGQLALAHYERLSATTPVLIDEPEIPAEQPKRVVYECPHCLSQYDGQYGEPHRGIAPQTQFADLPDQYSCGLCDAPKTDFIQRLL